MEKDFSTLFEFLPIGAYRTRPDGVMVRANPALVRLNGFTCEAAHLAAINSSEADWYVEPGRRAEFRRLLDRDGVVRAFESEVCRFGTASRLWVSENAHLVRDAEGRPRYYEGTVEEVTERVQSRAVLERKERELREITDRVPGVVYRVSVDRRGTMRFDFISRGVRALLGLEPEQVVEDERVLVRLRHPEDRERVGATVARAVARRTDLDIEYRVVLPGGEEKWLHQNSRALDRPDGTQVRIGVMSDISERKRAELALQRNGELWKQALEGSGDGVWDWDVQAGREQLSAACLALYGLAPDEVDNSPDLLDSMTHPDDLPGMHRARIEHFEGRSPTYVNEHRVRCKDGSWKWILSRGMVLTRDASGRPLRMIGTHTDITARMQTEALRAERDRAAADDRAKSQFLSRVSHELRTPLNAVLGFSQLLELEPGGGEKQRHWIAQVLAAGRHLLALMDDVLDLSSAQTGQLAMATESVALQPLLTEVLALFSGNAATPGITLERVGADEMGLAVRADRKRLLQVLSNLVSNAIKYNRPDGWVRLDARAVGATVEISVADSGHGIDTLQQTRLFQPFERLGAQRGAVSGTGLGLALSRQLTEAMTGRIEVESLPGRGSVFTVILPAA